MKQAYIAVAPEGYVAPADDKEVFQSLIEVLNWLSVITRLDITYTVSNLSRSLKNPTPDYMKAAKRVLRYLAGTVNNGLLYKSGEHDSL